MAVVVRDVHCKIWAYAATPFVVTMVKGIVVAISSRWIVMATT